MTKKRYNLTTFLNGSMAIYLGKFIGWALNRKTGFKLADFIARWITRHENYAKVRAVKANQWVVWGQLKELEEHTFQVFQSALRSLFDYFHFLNKPEALRKLISFSPHIQPLMERIRLNQPCVLVGPHLSNFELLGYSLTLKGIKAQILSFPNPNDAYKAQNKLRRETGIEITPISHSAFRQALKRLRDGGVVVTGLDRPISEEKMQKYGLEFFGKTAHLPVIHIRLAKEVKAPIFVLSFIMSTDLNYQMQVSDAIWIEPDPDQNVEIVRNAERVLLAAEEQINQAPAQWAMFFPVWPEALDEINKLKEMDRYG